MAKIIVQDLEAGQTVIIAIVQHEEEYEDPDDGEEEDIPEDIAVKVLNLVGAKV
jgi:hypothetical protein